MRLTASVEIVATYPRACLVLSKTMGVADCPYLRQSLDFVRFDLLWFIQFSMCTSLLNPDLLSIGDRDPKATEYGGPGWTRTTDLTLIRRAL